ncbi:carboxylesterase family protein [Micromonospora sp. NPDC049559]|uniref:carboxylesterase/lipase family protein n=1 Tax=Micromonospora sp. NPDC049559 TaxID=3155923 RepID=UPI0034230AA3
MRLLSLAATLLMGVPVTGPAAHEPPATPDRSVVRTDLGTLRGTVDGDRRTFQGIPYAAPPVGALRWRAPQDPAPWSGVRDATAPGRPCAQQPSADPTVVDPREDCLYLNVTTPTAPGRDRPVIVWLHGGSFQTGTGSAYDARRLAAAGDTVVVTVNYRLGVFGYFGLPGLAGSGTFGLQDQQAALRWVRRNAAAFGGDPHNVTLAGQSAGGLSVCAQLTSPAAAGLFDKAIIQSGSCLLDWPAGLFFGLPAGSQWTDRAALETAGHRLAGELGCAEDDPETLACLRAVGRDELIAATTGVGQAAFALPAYGNPVLPANPADALRAGAFRRVPVLSGSNLDEFRGFLGAVDEWLPYTAEQYAAALDAAFGDQAGRVAAAYPVAAYADRPGLAWAAVATDRMWACPTLAGDRLLARHTPVYGYEFAERHGPALDDAYPWGASHGYELPYLFDGIVWLRGTAQPELAGEMVREWSRFAATGATSWPRVRADATVPYVRTLAAGGSGRVDFGAEHRCAFWATVPDA